MNAVGNLIRGTAALGALAILTGAVVLNPLVTGWMGGYVANAKFQEQGVEEAHERYFRTLCTDYYNASYLERWTSPRHFGNGWCADYKHRL
ncbi:hypothetical protein [Ensifer sp. B1-9]|uniref:hypothetical protein n=1 Tax=Ensifer sp. B1-9 TaxID=3141455 RepID=UPI003D242476